MEHFEEARSLMRKMIPVARRVIGKCNITTLTLRKIYAEALYYDTDATLDEFREAVTTLEDVAPITRRVMGSAHPRAVQTEVSLQNARAALRAREAPPSGGA